MVAINPHTPKITVNVNGLNTQWDDKDHQAHTGARAHEKPTVSTKTPSESKAKAGRSAAPTPVTCWSSYLVSVTSNFRVRKTIRDEDGIT